MINILGAAALLLWGLRMVGVGVTTSFGAGLRRGINRAARNRLIAFLAGLFVTLGLQSSTATCLMVASFAGGGAMDGATAQVAMLGANVGTSLIVKLLTFDVGAFSAILILSGALLFRSAKGRRVAGILVGLGLMLLALRMLDLASEPLRDSARFHQVLRDLDGLWLVGLVLAAVLAMLAHSSVASILLILPLAAKGDFGLPFGLALILGANLGSALSPVLETGGESTAARRVPLGNALVRLAGCLLALPWLDRIALLMSWVSTDRAAQLVDFHVLLNLILAAVFLLPAPPLASLLCRLLPDETGPGDPFRPKYLDAMALSSPATAVAAALRETLRIGDRIEGMLRDCLALLRTGDSGLADAIGRGDTVVDALHTAVKLHLARLLNGDLGETDRSRAGDIMTFVINLEHIGDIVDHNLKELGEKRIRYGLSFPAEGFADIEAMFDRTLRNLRVATSVLVSGDAGLARHLVTEKDRIRALERNAVEAHLSRIGNGRRDSIETSMLHLDILRDLKRINAHIASVAYPILEQTGALGATRLKGESRSFGLSWQESSH